MVIGVVVAALVCAGIMEYRQRDLYWYDASADYRFDFTGQDVQVIQVPLSADGTFEFPVSKASWQTALVRLEVESRLLASWWEPSVSVRAVGTVSCQQHFERRASGTRYVNLCSGPGDLPAGSRVVLEGRNLSLPAQMVEVMLFRAPPLDSARILVVAPHPDDAEIAAYGLYAHRNSWIVTATTGSYGGDRYAGLATTRTERDSLEAKLREWDSMVVPTMGGLSPNRSINLGYFTTHLETMRRAPLDVVKNRERRSATVLGSRSRESMLSLRPSVSTWENLVGDLVSIIGRVAPTVIVFPHPALDANRDHIFTADAVLESLQRLEDPVADLLLYTNHHVHAEYYPFGPSGDAVTLPPWFSGAVTFRSLYSAPLSPALQREKLFALDAMHDLRAPPELVVGSVPARIVSRMAKAVRDVWRDPARELSYIRRAVRSNELFFAYRGDDRAVLQRLLPSSPRVPVARIRAPAYRPKS